MSTLPYHPPSATNVSAVEGEKRQMVRGKEGFTSIPLSRGEREGITLAFIPFARREEKGRAEAAGPLLPPFAKLSMQWLRGRGASIHCWHVDCASG